MNWYSWTTLKDFEAWHNLVIAGLNLPRVGVNARTGTPQPDKQATTAYTNVMQVNENDWRAFVEPHVANAYPYLLGLTCEMPTMNIMESEPEIE